MPTYEYECRNCGIFERFQQITEPPYKKCPLCKGAVKRLFGTGAGIIFKGTGFYATDYRSKNYKETASKEDKPVCKKDNGKSCPKKETCSG